MLGNLTLLKNVKYGVEEYIAPITITQAANRIYLCGEALGMTHQKAVSFDHIKNEYKDLYGVELNRNELKTLFGYSQAKKALEVVSRYFNIECKNGGIYLYLTRPNSITKAEFDELLEIETLEMHNKVPVKEDVDTNLSNEELIKMINEIDLKLKGNIISESTKSSYDDDESSNRNVDGSTNSNDEETGESNDGEDDEDNSEASSIYKEKESLYTDDEADESEIEQSSNQVQSTSISKTDKNVLNLSKEERLKLTFEELEKYFIKTTLPEENKIANLPVEIYKAIDPEIDKFTTFENSIKKEFKQWFNDAKKKLSEDKFLEDLNLIIQTMTTVYDQREKMITDLNEKLEEIFDKYLPESVNDDEDNQNNDSDIDLMF